MGQSASSPSSSPSPSAPRSPSYAYSRLPAHDPDDDGDDPETAITLARSPSKRRSRSCRHHCCRAKTFELTVMILSFTAAAALLGFANFVRIARDDSTRTVPGMNDVSVREASRWAQYAPFVPTAAYTPPREGCRVVQVNLLQRHGARWPTSGARVGQVEAVSKLQAVARDFTDPRLDFLRGFKYDWGSDDLLPYGALQSQEAGEVMFERYAPTALIGEGNLPFVRAADKARVVDSATNWTAGVFAASGGAVDPILNVEISESGNITLDDSMCPNAVEGDESAEWLAAFAPPIVARLNAWAPGANLTEEDALSLMDMCPFHTAVEQERSPFCELFEAGEFEAYEYFYDLDKFYGTGYGNALGPVQGVGYVNELIARLTGEAVRDNTQTNRTLDADPETFPLDRTFYADFSHDNEMVAIYSAMGLFRQRAMLPTTKVDRGRTWINSRLVPFSSRMVVEKVECGGAGEEFVRVMVGDEVQPLEFCGVDGEGMCTLDAFVDSQRYAREDGQGDFEKCGFVSS